ncbi:MAG: hypothetical protein KGH93_02815 [Patescibacteria group bacterium]|nr:hypothetical protein [Patescibacteria group bacterium]MDE1946102.1 hypothetical protein [Patescibacteria group bacterium]
MKKNILIAVLCIALAGSITASVVLYGKLSALSSNPQQAAQDQANAIIRAASKLIVLPEGETPSVVKVTDPSQLADQPFFANARAGDYVLLYYTEKKAVLYNPMQNQIVNVGPFDVNSAGSAAVPASATSTASAGTQATGGKKK